MCTMSWFKTEDGYELFFNRDEHKTRRRADIPVLTTQSGVDVISPTDTDAGGTWVSVNHFGLSLCLLNHYEKEQRIPHIDWISRGGIIRSLATHASLSVIEYTFAQIDLNEYKPFRLFALDAQGKSVFFTWDGETTTKEFDIVTPRSSSSFEPEKVRAGRKQQFVSQGLHESTDRVFFLAFHCSHDPSASAYSVCMHRDDANSVSLSHIVVNKQEVTFAYADGAPCKAELSQPIGVPLRTSIKHDAA